MHLALIFEIKSPLNAGLLNVVLLWIAPSSRVGEKELPKGGKDQVRMELPIPFCRNPMWADQQRLTNPKRQCWMKKAGVEGLRFGQKVVSGF